MACCTSLNPSNLPRAVRGRKYNQIFTPTCGGVVSYDITIQSGTLPPGLSFSQSTGSPAVISGVPSRTGNFTIVLKLSSPECEDVFKSYRISIFSNKKTVGYNPYPGRVPSCGGNECNTVFTCYGGRFVGLSFYRCINGECAYTISGDFGAGNCGSSS